MQDETETDITLNAAMVPMTQVPVDTTGLVPKNRGGVGDSDPLTSVITIKKGQEIIKVSVLFDTGSEDSYFAAGDLERYAQTKKAKKFTLQSLSTQAGEETAMLCYTMRL